MAQFWTVYWGFCSFVFGAIVGSFLNVCIWRLPRGESLAKPPSHCPKCDHSLKLWPDMVPLCSQVWCRARCRYCGTPFSWRYFWIELLTAALFTGANMRYAVFTNSRLDDFTQTGVLLCTFAFISCLVVIFFTDLDSYQIHDGTVALAALAGILKDLLLIRAGERPLWHGVPGLPAAVQLPIPESVFSALISCWLLWQFAALVTAARGEEAMGDGDPLLLGAMGAVLLPWPLMVLAFIFAVFLGTIGGVSGMWRHAHTERQASAPEVLPGNPDASSDTQAPPDVPEIGGAPPQATVPGDPDPPPADDQWDSSERDHPIAAQAEPPEVQGAEPVCSSSIVTPVVPGSDTTSALPEAPASPGPVTDARQHAVAHHIPPAGGADSACAEAAQPAPDWDAASGPIGSPDGTGIPSLDVEAAVTSAESSPSALEGEGTGGSLLEQEGETGEAGVVPIIPTVSRWGRVGAVLGSWIVVAGLWAAGRLFGESPAVGIATGLLSAAIGGACCWFSVQACHRADKVWLEAMDKLFDDGEPGPRFIPFGPYLVAGTFVAMFFGKELVELYLTQIMALSPAVISGLRW